jgi:hypothetical protein
METCTHELVHSYENELSLHALDLKDDQISEFYAEMFCKYGAKILSDARLIVENGF